MDDVLTPSSKAIEKIKYRQKAEIEQIIETQIKNENIAKQNEEKERKQRQREEEAYKALQQKRKDEEEKRANRSDGEGELDFEEFHEQPQ